MILPGLDWTGLWKIYSRLFLSAYFITGAPLRIWFARTRYPRSSGKVWLVSCAATVLYLPCIPFTAGPAFLPVLFFPTHDAASSIVMAVPIALSVGFFGALLDAAAFRLLLRERLAGRRFASLLGLDSLNALIAILIVFAWMAIYPPNIVARLAR